MYFEWKLSNRGKGTGLFDQFSTLVLANVADDILTQGRLQKLKVKLYPEG